MSKVTITNKTGNPHDTKLLVDGKDVLPALMVRGITIQIGDKVTATLECHIDEMDITVLPDGVVVHDVGKGETRQ